MDMDVCTTFWLKMYFSTLFSDYLVFYFIPDWCSITPQIHYDAIRSISAWLNQSCMQTLLPKVTLPSRVHCHVHLWTYMPADFMSVYRILCNWDVVYPCVCVFRLKFIYPMLIGRPAAVFLAVTNWRLKQAVVREKWKRPHTRFQDTHNDTHTIYTNDHVW